MLPKLGDQSWVERRFRVEGPICAVQHCELRRLQLQPLLSAQLAVKGCCDLSTRTALYTEEEDLEAPPPIATEHGFFFKVTGHGYWPPPTLAPSRRILHP